MGFLWNVVWIQNKGFLKKKNTCIWVDKKTFLTMKPKDYHVLLYLKTVAGICHHFWMSGVSVLDVIISAG